MRIAMLAGANKRHTHRWCRFMVGRGHQVRLFSDKPPLADMDYAGIPIVAPEWSRWQNFLTYRLNNSPYANNRDKWRAYRRAIESYAPDLLHAHEALAYGPCLAHFPAIPGILTPWGPDMENDTPEARALVTAAVRAARIVSTNAPGMESAWAARFGVPEARFRLFPWGADLSLFHPGAASPLPELPASGPILLSPRIASPYYRIPELLDAWRTDPAPGATLVLLRAGADDAAWRSAHHAARSLPSVLPIDRFLAPGEMAALYARADATIMLPRTDLLAASLIECLACGSLPILADNPCYRAAVADVAAPEPDRARGYFAAEHSPDGIAGAIRRWAATPTDRRHALRASNAAWARQHAGAEAAGAAMESLYREVLASARR